MRKALTWSIAALTAVSAVAFSTSAAADHDRYDNDDNEVGAAIIGGVLGFALGAAVGSSSNRNRYGSYGYGSSPYYGGSYGSPYGYGYGSSSPYYGGSYGYGSPYYGSSRYGYGSPYYGGSYGGYGYNSYGYGCRTERVWDRYYGRYVTRQVC